MQEPELNPFEILTVSINADVQAIKAAYRKLAKLCHPDLTGIKDSSQFRILDWAYKSLLDPLKREAFRERYSTKKRSTSKTHTPKTTPVAPKSPAEKKVYFDWTDQYKEIFKTIAKAYAKKYKFDSSKYHDARIVLDVNWDTRVVVTDTSVRCEYLGLDMFMLLHSGNNQERLQAETILKWSMFQIKKMARSYQLFR